MSPPLSLDAALDTAAAPMLARTLAARIAGRSDVHMDGAAVERVGQACLQVLMSARMSAHAAGLDFAINNASDPLDDAATLLGLGALLTPATPGAR